MFIISLNLLYNYIKFQNLYIVMTCLKTLLLITDLMGKCSEQNMIYRLIVFIH